MYYGFVTQPSREYRLSRVIITLSPSVQSSHTATVVSDEKSNIIFGRGDSKILVSAKPEGWFSITVKKALIVSIPKPAVSFISNTTEALEHATKE